MILVVNPMDYEAVKERLRQAGEEPVEIGWLVEKKGDELISFLNLERAFNRAMYSRERNSRRVKVSKNRSGLSYSTSGWNTDLRNRYQHGQPHKKDATSRLKL